MDTSSPPVLSVSPLITGPRLVGVVLNWWLYGILTMQYLMYINGGSRDRKWLRVTVFLIDTIQSFVTLSDLFYWFVYHFGNTSTIYNLHLSSIGGPFTDAMIALIVQLVYCWRIWVLGQWKILPVITGLLSVVSCGAGMALGVRVVIKQTVKALTTADYVVHEVWLSVTAFTDVVIAVCLTYLLLKYRPKNSSRKYMAAVKRIMLLALETNTLTTLFALIYLAFLLVPPIKPENTNLFVTLYVFQAAPGFSRILFMGFLSGCVLGKLYSNSFMVLLNQRARYRRTELRTDPKKIQFKRLTSSMVSEDSDIFVTSSLLHSQDEGAEHVSAIRFADSTSDVSDSD